MDSLSILRCLQFLYPMSPGDQKGSSLALPPRYSDPLCQRLPGLCKLLWPFVFEITLQCAQWLLHQEDRKKRKRVSSNLDTISVAILLSRGSIFIEMLLLWCMHNNAPTLPTFFFNEILHLIYETESNLSLTSYTRHLHSFCGRLAWW